MRLFQPVTLIVLMALSACVSDDAGPQPPAGAACVGFGELDEGRAGREKAVEKRFAMVENGKEWSVM